MALSRVVSGIFDVEKYRDLEIPVKGQSRSLKGSPVIWATNHLGDRQVGDSPTGRQPTGRHILVNWATEVETTGPQLWKCKRLTIALQS